MFLRGRTMFAPTMRVVDGADPYKLKLKHSQQTKQKCAFHPVSAQTKSTPAMHFQRACGQCVHESARLFRAICLHAWYSLDCGERKTADFCFILCRTHLPRTARATNSCTRGNEPMHAVRWLASPRQEECFFKRAESPLK